MPGSSRARPRTVPTEDMYQGLRPRLFRECRPERPAKKGEIGMSYASTAQTGSLGRQASSDGFGKKVGAGVLTVLVGAAIAAGIAISSSDGASTNSMSTDADRVLVGKITATDVSADADTVLKTKTGSGATTSDWSFPTTYDGLVEGGFIPAPAESTSDWSYPTKYGDLVQQGYIPTPHQPAEFAESPGQPR